MCSEKSHKESFREYYDDKFEEVFERVSEVSEYMTDDFWPSHIDSHFEEACYCFYYGQFQASIIMNRATLEVAIRYRMALKKDHEENLSKQELMEEIKQRRSWSLFKLMKEASEQNLFSKDDSQNKESFKLANELRKKANKYTHVRYNSLTKNSKVTKRKVKVWAKGGNSGVTPAGEEKVKEPENFFERDFVMRQEAEKEALRLLEITSKIIDSMDFQSTKNLPSVVS